MESLFPSFFIGGFECSSHRLSSGRRLDLVAATKHDKFVRQDYLRLQEQGIETVREGLRWHLIEPAANRHDFSSALPMVRAARDLGLKVIWDLFHFGYPDDLTDIFSAAFVRGFANLAREFTRLLASEGDEVPYIAPINEISYFAWAGGEVGRFAPFARGRGEALKRQLVKATVEAIESIWSVSPRARIFHIDPMCNIVADPARPESEALAEAHCRVQYHAWDMICGHLQPQLGGKEEYLDIIGVNYYPTNQWIFPGGLELIITGDHPLYRPPRHLIRDIYQRYKRPMFISETGTEGDGRGAWLAYMCNEVRAARRDGVRIEGICLYPIINHPGWEDNRHCHNGLWDYPDEGGGRQIYAPLSSELSDQRLRLGIGH